MNEMSYSEIEDATYEVFTNQLYNNQEIFDRLMTQYENYMLSFDRDFISDMILNRIHVQNEEIRKSFRKNTFQHKLSKFLRNSLVVVRDNKTTEDRFIFVNKDYQDRELQSIIRIRANYNSKEKSINKRLVRLNLLSIEEINRVPFRYDNYELKKLRDYQRQYLLIRLVDSKLLTYMSIEEKSVIRLNRKRQIRLDSKRNSDTKNLMNKLLL